MNPKSDEENKLNPVSNVAQDDYDKKFNSMPSTPEMQSFAEQADASAANNFAYSGDADRANVAEQESGQSSPQSEASESELAKIKKSTGEEEGGWRTKVDNKIQRSPLGKARNFLNSRKKVVIAASSLGGGSILIGLALLMMLFSSGLGLRQLAEVLRTANFSAIHLANYRRTSQYFVEEALNNAVVSGEGRLNSLGKRTVPERLSGYDANKILTNLGEKDIVKFNYTSETKTGWFRTTTTSELKGITIGSQSILIPADSGGKTSRAFIKEVDSAIQDTALFAEKSRWVRTKTANYIIDASGIKLSRWQSAGRKIKTFKDAVISAYEYLKTKVGISSTLEDVNNIHTDFEENLPAALEKPGVVANGAGVTAAEQMAESVSAKASGFKDLARKGSIAAMFATIYCGARDYIDQQDLMAEQKIYQAKRSAEQLQTASDQTGYGDTTTEAVDLEMARYSDFETSYAYQDGVGALDKIQTKKPDLDPSEYPKPDNDSIIYKIFKAAKTGGDAAFKPLANSPISPLGVLYIANGFNYDKTMTQVCKAVNTTAGQAAMLLGESILNILAATASGGSSAAAEAAAKGATEEAVSIAFREGMKKVALSVVLSETKNLAKNVALMKGFELVLGFLMERTKGTDSPALDDGRTLAAKADMGEFLLANDAAQATGGRPLSDNEETSLKVYERQVRVAALHKKSLWYRLASLDNPYSPVSRFAVSYPSNPESFIKKGREFAVNTMNPFSQLANSVNNVVASTAIAPEVALATSKTSTTKYGIPKIALSAPEMDKMLEPSFWPRANAAWVEVGDRLTELDKDFGSCYNPLVKKAKMSDECENKLRNGSSNFSADEAFRYRLYRGMEGGLGEDETKPLKTDFNQGLFGQLVDFQEVRADTANAPTTGNQTKTDIITGDTSGIPCDAGVDNGEADGYSKGNLVKIRICNVQGIVVNSQISKKVDDMINKARSAGIALTGSGFRTMAKQQELYAKFLAGTGNEAAKPGYSNHQMGLAMDLNYSELGVSLGTCKASPKRYPTYNWLSTNGSYYGFYAKVTSECWHWSVSGN